MKILLSLTIALLSLMQPAIAATTNLVQSIFEIQSILNSPLILSVIPQTEFIFDIQRKTQSTDLDDLPKVVIYDITTRLTSDSTTTVLVDDHLLLLNDRTITKKYKVQLTLSTNPVIGPPVITVDSITPISCHHHCHKSFDNEELSY